MEVECAGYLAAVLEGAAQFASPAGEEACLAIARVVALAAARCSSPEAQTAAWASS